MSQVCITNVKSLEQLCRVLNDAPTEDDSQPAIIQDFAESWGLPFAHGDIDYTSLPTFDDVEPVDTAGIFSYDADEYLVPDNGSSRRWKLIPRPSEEVGA